WRPVRAVCAAGEGGSKTTKQILQAVFESFVKKHALNFRNALFYGLSRISFLQRSKPNFALSPPLSRNTVTNHRNHAGESPPFASEICESQAASLREGRCFCHPKAKSPALLPTRKNPASTGQKKRAGFPPPLDRS
ncbi:hypothetical protein V5299_01525, partial [Celeribacter halophilus]